jgi:hypothetical protein
VKLVRENNQVAVGEMDAEPIMHDTWLPAECGEQLSEVCLSEVECRSDATKKDRLKRTLLETYQDEFD